MPLRQEEKFSANQALSGAMGQWDSVRFVTIFHRIKLGLGLGVWHSGGVLGVGAGLTNTITDYGVIMKQQKIVNMMFVLLLSCSGFAANADEQVQAVADSKPDRIAANEDSANPQSAEDATRGLDRARERMSDEGMEHNRAMGKEKMSREERKAMKKQEKAERKANKEMKSKKEKMTKKEKKLKEEKRDKQSKLRDKSKSDEMKQRRKSKSKELDDDDDEAGADEDDG